MNSEFTIRISQIRHLEAVLEQVQDDVKQDSQNQSNRPQKGYQPHHRFSLHTVIDRRFQTPSNSHQTGDYQGH